MSERLTEIEYLSEQIRAAQRRYDAAAKAQPNYDLTEKNKKYRRLVKKHAKKESITIRGMYRKKGGGYTTDIRHSLAYLEKKEIG